MIYYNLPSSSDLFLICSTLFITAIPSSLLLWVLLKLYVILTYFIQVNLAILFHFVLFFIHSFSLIYYFIGLY